MKTEQPKFFEDQKPVDAFSNREEALAIAEKVINQMLTERGITADDVERALERIKNKRKREVWN